MAKKKGKKVSAGRRKRRSTRPTPKPRPLRSSPSKEKVADALVTLSEGKGSKGTGGGAGGHFWHIFCDEKRAGRVFVNLIDEEPFGKHASVQIYLNKQSQGKGIGRVAYRLACESSKYDEVYAHMRKSNEASKRAALAAGFEIIDHDKVDQLAMRWRRQS